MLKKFKIYRRFSKILLIFLLVTSWTLSGWPRLYFSNFMFPPEVGEAHAAAGAYTELFATVSCAGTLNTWNDLDLTASGVPDNAVAEIALVNSATTVERRGGVRANGSSLNRYTYVRETEGGGLSWTTMNVQTDSGAVIDCFTDSLTGMTFRVLGYWACTGGGCYTERMDTLGAASPDVWEDEALSSFGVSAGQAVEVLINNTDQANSFYGGVRTDGSSLERRFKINETESSSTNSRSPLTMHAKAVGASAIIDIYEDDTTAIENFLIGYWPGPPGKYIELFTTIAAPASNSTWTDKDLSASVPASRATEVVVANGANAAATQFGVRTNGSALGRFLYIVEAEDAAGDALNRQFGRYTTNVDASSILEIYHTSVTSTPFEFQLVGYWETVDDTQIHYRWRNDDNNEANATFAKAQDTAFTDFPKTTTYRLRLEISNEGTGTDGGRTHELQVAETATCSSGTYAAVPTDTSGDWQIVNIANLTNGNDTTNVSVDSGLTDENTTFVAGDQQDTSATTGSITLGATNFTEIEYALQATTNATSGGAYCFRLTNVDTYTVYAQATIVSPPGAPTLYNDDGGSNQIAFNNARINDATPIFRASATHTTTFNRFQIELNATPDFSGTAYTETFSGTYSSATAYNLQTTGTLALPTTDGVTYYVRARASADGGSEYGSWSSTTWTYTYKASGNPDWFQTTDEQFATGTLSSTQTSGSDSVQLGAGTGTSISRVSTYQYLSGYATSYTFNTLPARVAGDIVVVLMASDSDTESVTPPSGFSQVQFNCAATRCIWAYAKEITGNESSSYTFSITADPTEWHEGWGIVYRGDGTALHIDDSDYIGPSASEPLTLPALTTTVPSAKLVMMSYHGGNQTPTLTPSDTVSVVNDSSNGGVLYDGDKSSAGSTGTLELNYASASDQAGIWLAIRSGDALASSGTILSSMADYDRVLSASSWNNFTWSETETNGTVMVQLYYTSSTTCDTIVPNAALSDNETGFSTGPVDITGLNTTTYNEICLKATLTNSSGTPYLLDWTITWNAGAGGPTFTLSHYKWYVNAASENVTDIWGNPDLTESGAIYTLPATNDPPENADQIRLRVAITIGTADLSATSQQFKLQYKQDTDDTCTTASGTWTDVAAAGTGTIWRFTSLTDVTDGANLTVAKISVTDVLEEYARSNPTETNHNSATTGQDIEYDFHIQHNAAADATTYYFRVVESDGTEFTGSPDPYPSCPKLQTRPGTANLLRHGNHFVDQLEKGFIWAD